MIRCGLVFQLKASIGAAEIRRREDAALGVVLAKLSRIPQIRLLGDPAAARVPIVALLIECVLRCTRSGEVVAWCEGSAAAPGTGAYAKVA